MRHKRGLKAVCAERNIESIESILLCELRWDECTVALVTAPFTVSLAPKRE
jgi:hypothetical protein